MKALLIITLGIVISLSGFIVHVITVEWLPSWIGSQMQGLQVQASWDVRNIAAITSIEYGLAAIGLYYLGREKLLKIGKFKSALLFSVLLIAIHGTFIRQPLMDFVSGNPLHVTLVQNAFQWLPRILTAFITVYGYELIQNVKRKPPPVNEHTK